jgi:hypothetical protein
MAYPHPGIPTTRPGLRSAAGLALVLLLAGARGAPAAEFHYVMVFGSQRPLGDPRFSHTFATFVRASGYGPDSRTYQLEAHTISWMPASGDIRVAALLPEPGVNMDLLDTLRWAVQTGQRVTMWGPYRIDPELYERALRQVALLESGQVRYKAVDSGFLTDHVSNCIHAVASVTEGYRRRIFLPGWGDMASLYVTRQFAAWIRDGWRTHDWVSDRLGLGAFPIRRPKTEPEA